MSIVMSIITSDELKISIFVIQWRQLLFISTADLGSSPTYKSVFGNLIKALVWSRDLDSCQGWYCVNECRWLHLHIHSAAQSLRFRKLLHSPQIIYAHLSGFTQPSTLTLTHSVAPFHPVTVPFFQSPINAATPVQTHSALPFSPSFTHSHSVSHSTIEPSTHTHSPAYSHNNNLAAFDPRYAVLTARSSLHYHRDTSLLLVIRYNWRYNSLDIVVFLMQHFHREALSVNVSIWDLNQKHTLLQCVA